MKILVIADVHGNAEALEAVLRRESDADATLFLGDAVLSGPQPNKTMELLCGIENGTFLMGNHDLELLDPSIFENWPEQWVALNNGIIEKFDATYYDFVEGFLPHGEYELGGVPMYLHHGMIAGGPRHALPDTPVEQLRTFAFGSHCPYVLFGHSHVQFTREIEGQTFINPGSVGQNRCGKQIACYGVMQDGAYRHCQVEYDQAPVLKAFDQVGTLDAFPDFREWLKEGLVTGYGIGRTEPWTRYAAEGYC